MLDLNSLGGQKQDSEYGFVNRQAVANTFTFTFTFNVSLMCLQLAPKCPRNPSMGAYASIKNIPGANVYFKCCLTDVARDKNYHVTLLLLNF